MRHGFHNLSERIGRLPWAGKVLLASRGQLRASLWRLAGRGKPGGNQHQPVVVDGEDRLPLTTESLAGRLASEKDFLLSLIGTVETEFLATGRGLTELARHLNEIQQVCASLTELTLGQTQDAPVQFAFQLLKKAEDMVLASYDQYDHVFMTFGELDRKFALLSKQHHELMRVLLPLNFITMSFRIEASRHPAEVQQAFFTLAESMHRTVNEVRETMEQQLADLERGGQMARSLMEQLSTSIQKHRLEVAAALQTSRRQLRDLSETLASSGAGATSLAQLNKTVTRQIGEIVIAQQCQDIARQRIEHVGEAMDEMCAQLKHNPAGGTATNGLEARQFIFQAGQIQLHQIQNVFDQLNDAAGTLTSGIQNLRSETGSAADTAVKLGGTTLDSNVASQCQAGIGQILEVVQQAVQKIADVVAAFEPLRASFVDCTRKAGALANDVRQAGLNAQIFAIRTSRGATLEVLAGRANSISEEVIDQVGQMGTALKHAVETVNNLRARLEDFQQLGQAEEEILASESARSQEKLAALEAAIPRLTQQVTERQAAFAQSIEGTLANVRFPALIAAASSRSLNFFRDLVAWGGDGRPEWADGSQASPKTDLLQSRYTMASERQTHAAALQSSLSPVTTNDTESSIEMFGEPGPPAPATVVCTNEAPASATAAAKESLPANLAPGENPPALDNAATAKNTAPGHELGDNVDLF